MDPIEKQVRIYLEAYGVENVDTAIKKIKKNTNLLNSSVSELIATYGSLDKAIKTVIDEEILLTSKGIQGSLKHQRAIQKLNHELYRYGGTLRTIVSGLKSLLIPAWGMAVHETLSYEKALLAVSARVNRLGIGILRLQSRMYTLASATKLTRKETLNLFNIFERGMKFVSLEDFFSILEKIRVITGANAQEMARYISSISSISKKFPGLARQIMRGTKVDKESIKLKIRALYLVNEIGDEEYRSIMALIRGNRQLTPLEQERQKRIDEHIKAMQEFKRQVERVAFAFGNELLPILEELAGWMKKIREFMKEIGIEGKTLARLFGLFIGYKLGKGLITGTAGLLSLGKTAAVAGGGGAGISTGGTIASLVGLKYLMGKGGTARASQLVAPAVAETRLIDTAFGATPVAVGGAAGAAKLGKLATLRAGAFTAAKTAAPAAIIAMILAIFERIAANQERSLIKQEQYSKSGKAGLAKIALGVGKWTAIGAAIGAYLGAPTGVGAPFGAGIGLIGGFFGGVFANLYGEAAQKAAESLARYETGKPSNIEAAGSAKYSLYLKEQEKKLKEIKELQKGVGKMPVTLGSYKKLQEEEEEALKKLKLIRKEFEDLMGEKTFKKEKEWFSEEDIAKMEKKEKRLKEAVELMKIGEIDQEKIASTQKQIEIKEKAIKEAKELRKEEEGKNEKLVEANRLYEEASVKAEHLRGIISLTPVLIGKLNEQVEKQKNLLGAIIGRQQTSGKIEKEEVLGAIESAVLAVEERTKREKEYVDILGYDIERVKEITKEQGKNINIRLKDVKSSKDLTKYSQATLEVLEHMGFEHLSLNTLMLARKIILGRLHNKSKEIADIWSQAGDEWLKYIDYQGNITDLIEQEINLSNNLAIGVGAAASLRLELFQQYGKKIYYMKEELAGVNAAIAKSSVGGEKYFQLLIKQAGLQKNILSVQVQQAGQVKALRDGWIGAINQLNTGANRFTKIVVGGEKNIAEMLRLAGEVGAVLSGPSGALRSIVGRPVGYKTPERFGLGGGIVGKKQEFAYPIPRLKGIMQDLGVRSMRDVEMGLREQFGSFLKSMGDIATGGGRKAPLALGVAAHPFHMGPILEKGARTYEMAGEIEKEKTKYTGPVEAGSMEAFAHESLQLQTGEIKSGAENVTVNFFPGSGIPRPKEFWGKVNNVIGDLLQEHMEEWRDDVAGEGARQAVTGLTGRRRTDLLK